MFTTTPVVFEHGMHGEQAYDVFSWLMRNKAIFVSSALDEEICNIICAQLLYADKQGWDEMDMYISSPGGLVMGLFAILDVMDTVNVKVNTICVGGAMSAAAILLASGHTRRATKRSRIMFHDIRSGSVGTYKDQTIQIKEAEKVRNEVADILTARTNLNRKDVFEKLLDRDHYLSAEEAIELGVVDSVYTKR